MSVEQRQEALSKLRKLSVNKPIISIIGGEPTLKPDFLVDAIRDTVTAGFFVNLVTNGWGLKQELIERLGKAGLGYLAISVDNDSKSPKRNIKAALEHLSVVKRYGIVPVIETVITRKTDTSDFRRFVRMIIEQGYFVNPLICSPAVPHGAFSNAPREATPTRQQLRSIVPWLAWQKLITGRVSTSFGYLWVLFTLKEEETGVTEVWHCASHFRTDTKSSGRGYITLDSDGYIGPCQEFPRIVNLLDIPYEELSLKLLDPQFSETTQKCPGCLYSCYVNEEKLGGFTTVAELTTSIRVADMFHNRHR